jgi:hypothetical protein
MYREAWERLGVMKFRRVIRIQLVLMALGAVLLVASPAHAQQDMAPTDFDVNPGVPHIDAKAVAQTARVSAASKPADSEASIPASLWSGQASQEETDLARLTVVDAAMIAIMLGGVGLIVLYAMAATRRERRLETSLGTGPYPRASGATAHQRA